MYTLLHIYIYAYMIHNSEPQADEGGESIAMDGFAAAESLYQQDPKVPWSSNSCCIPIR